MCWVMPPDSLDVILKSLIASNKELLPWSTCPKTTTTGGRFFIGSSNFFSFFVFTLEGFFIGIFTFTLI